MDWHSARAILEWHVELGATEAICDAPIDRYGLPVSLSSAPETRTTTSDSARTNDVSPRAAISLPPDTAAGIDPVALARDAAAQANTLDALRGAMGAYDHCDLRNGARNLVFADGRPDARVMILGEAPGRDEDRIGRPFVGQAGQLLDKMLAAIGMERNAPDPACAVYITNLLPWRPPNNRDPSPAERAMMKPFAERHIELADPDVLILMGRISASTLLDTSEGITRLRGQWFEVLGRPTLPMLHPAYLLRNPENKRHAWADLLALQARLRTLR